MIFSSGNGTGRKNAERSFSLHHSNSAAGIAVGGDAARRYLSNAEGSQSQ
jgi:hypothetical protein